MLTFKLDPTGNIETATPQEVEDALDRNSTAILELQAIAKRYGLYVAKLEIETGGSVVEALLKAIGE